MVRERQLESIRSCRRFARMPRRAPATERSGPVPLVESALHASRGRVVGASFCRRLYRLIDGVYVAAGTNEGSCLPPSSSCVCREAWHTVSPRSVMRMGRWGGGSEHSARGCRVTLHTYIFRRCVRTTINITQRGRLNRSATGT